MKKGIYGIYDLKSHNFGDVCILDKDEEFKAGCLDLFSNPDIPEYMIHDLVGARYGYVTFDSDDKYPQFHMAEIPTFLLWGKEVAVDNRREERIAESHAETQKDS